LSASPTSWPPSRRSWPAPRSATRACRPRRGSARFAPARSAANRFAPSSRAPDRFPHRAPPHKDPLTSSWWGWRGGRLRQGRLAVGPYTTSLGTNTPGLATHRSSRRSCWT